MNNIDFPRIKKGGYKDFKKAYYFFLSLRFDSIYAFNKINEFLKFHNFINMMINNDNILTEVAVR